jgi:hypothetical protein
MPFPFCKKPIILFLNHKIFMESIEQIFQLNNSGWIKW